MSNKPSLFRISAITFFVQNMKNSCKFYEQIPDMKIHYGGPNSSFSTYKIGRGDFFLNIEEHKHRKNHIQARLIFHVSDVDSIYSILDKNQIIHQLGKLETKPKDASWGERFFHLRDPDNYQLSFAKPLEQSNF